MMLDQDAGIDLIWERERGSRIPVSVRYQQGARDWRSFTLRESEIRKLRRALTDGVSLRPHYMIQTYLDRGGLLICCQEINGLADSESIIGSTWPQGNDALSMLVGPERLAHFLAAPPPVRRAEILATLVRLYGDAAGEPDALLERHWGVDPFTQGYISQWAPGDLTAVGPLHGTHEPPFYVCGSDHWVAGYMEGAVRTGRAAAAAALGTAAAAV